MDETQESRARDDGQLMAEVSAGSVEAFGELYDRYCKRAYNTARWICREDGRADDAVQEAFLSIWKNRASYRPQQGSVAAWLLTVVRYRALDVVRSDGQHAARRESDGRLESRSAPDDVCASAIKRDDSDRLQASLAMLPGAL